MTHDEIDIEAHNLLSAPYVTTIYRYYSILCETLDRKYKSGLGLTSEERSTIFDILCAQFRKIASKT